MENRRYSLLLINVNTIFCFNECQFLFVTYKKDRARIVYKREVVHVNSLKLFQSNQIRADLMKKKSNGWHRSALERIAEIENPELVTDLNH